MRTVAIVIALSTLPQLGAQAKIGLPDLGPVYDSAAKGIRPIYGLPGAAVVGPVSDLTPQFEEAAVSPARNVVIGFSPGSPDLQIVNLRDGGMQTIAVRGGVTRVVFSPLGQAAVVWSSSIQVLTGIGVVPELRDVVIPANENWAALAISDDGRRVLLASGSNHTAPVWLISESAARLPLPGSVVTAAFRGGSYEAVAATRSGDIYRIGDTGPSLVYTGDQRTADPVAIRFSDDGRYVYTASRSGMVALISLERNVADAVACSCEATGLEPVGPGPVFRIRQISEGPLLLFDAGGVKPRVWFVPRDEGGER